MTLTPERIAEIEREYGNCDLRLTDIFRLARLGLSIDKRRRKCAMRDRQLAADFLTGLGRRQLSEKYGISRERVGQVLISLGCVGKRADLVPLDE